MANRVTIQDIADALGISRNTVSKAINNTGILADATREKILKKAVEMGYKQFAYFTADDVHKSELFTSDVSPKGEIALFTTVFWGNLILSLPLWTLSKRNCPVAAIVFPCTASWTMR